MTQAYVIVLTPGQIKICVSTMSKSGRLYLAPSAPSSKAITSTSGDLASVEPANIKLDNSPAMVYCISHFVSDYIMHIHCPLSSFISGPTLSLNRCR